MIGYEFEEVAKHERIRQKQYKIAQSLVYRQAFGTGKSGKRSIDQISQKRSKYFNHQITFRISYVVIA